MSNQIIQPMPELSPEQWDALAANITANGVLVPVVKDQYGRILDGNTRAAIADKLGIDYPVKVVEVANDEDAWDKAVALNCARRHLNREQTRELIRAEILRRPDQSNRSIAGRVGCCATTVGTVRAEVKAAEEAERQRLAAERQRVADEERRRAEELTNRAREEVNNFLGQLAVGAFLRHRDGGTAWQSIGDVMERKLLGEMMCHFDREADREVLDAIWQSIYGPFFDSVRSYDCNADCATCTPHDRAWRDSHPKQVYRWPKPPEVSNLDTEEAE